MLKIRKILLLNYIYIILLIISLSYCLIITNFIKYESIYNINETSFDVCINNISIDGNKLSLEVTGKEKLTAYYYIDNIEEKAYLENNLFIGDTIHINGNLKVPSNNTVPNTFNYKNYLYNNKIYYLLEIETIKKISNNKNIFNSIKSNIVKRINKFKYSKEYLHAFILGDTSYINASIKDTYSNNGVSHLFAISGMHVSLLTVVLISFLIKIKIREFPRYLIVTLFLLFYMFLTNFSPSILRAALFFILLSINKIYYFHIKPINILFVTFSILVIINPFIIYNIGFLFSFTISMFLIIFGNLINKYNNYFYKTFIVSLISFLASLPISIYNFYNINLFSIFINLIFVPFVSIIVFPLTLITFFISPLDIILNFFINILEYISVFFSNIKIFNIILPKINLFVVFIYYLVIILVLYKLNNSKIFYILLIFILIFIHTNIRYLDKNIYITFIDIGQGDSCLIELPYNKGVLFIDTGGRLNFIKETWMIRNSNSTLAKNALVPLLKSKGIKKIDYLILTHGDADHMGEAKTLNELFEVDNILFNNYGMSYLEREFYKVRNDIIKVKSGDTIKIDEFIFNIINPSKNINENENSIIIYTELYNNKILLTGDAGIKVEPYLIKNYNIKDIDIFKVGHHGSKHSSSIEFLEYVNPKYSIISVGENNNFGHPSDIVIKNLNKVNTEILRTDKLGSIEFIINKNSVSKTYNIP